MTPLASRWVAALVVAAAAGVPNSGATAEPPGDRAAITAVRGAIELQPCPVPGTDQQMLCGSVEVFENRQDQAGRRITLNVAVLPARSTNPRPDPILYLAGGPGGSATARAAAFSTSWMRDERDIVMIDQRGTGGSNPLRCELHGGPTDTQGYLLNGFDDPNLLGTCLRRLETFADPSLYTTPIAVDDIDEARLALGYGQVDLLGLSWGSRSALVYLRRHPESVRRAVLSGVVPLALIYPLYHAADSQHSLDLVLDECAHDAACGAAFPYLASELGEVFQRLEQAPVSVTVRNPDTDQPATVELDRDAFAEWVRWTLASRSGTRWLPQLIHWAHEGRFEEIVQDLVETTQFYNQRLAFGELMSVVCSADVSRIDPAQIPGLTQGTFMGDVRVREVMAACAVWDRAEMPPGYGDPVESDVPTLLWSGTLDPEAPPRWGVEAATHLAHRLHLVVPDSHGVQGPCIDAVTRDFFDSPSPLDIDTSCTRAIRLPPFQIPSSP